VNARQKRSKCSKPPKADHSRRDYTLSLRHDRDDSVTNITIDRPEQGNRLSNQMAAEIAAMIEAGRDSHLIVLRSEGADFCLGRDLGGSMRGASGQTALEVREHNTEPVLALLAAVRRCRAPVLAIVQGRAIGLGAGLAAVCDLTIAADDASFQLPEMSHGIPPCLAMSALIDHVPRKAILHLVYAMETLGAQEAIGLGLVGRVVPAAELRLRADELIRSIAAQPLAAVRAVKEYMRSAPQMDAQGAADFGSNLLAGVLSSTEPH
jgi:enoyl-CoA hydratase/carnithine racemase